jgi:AcrR family transcriptional regulator
MYAQGVGVTTLDQVVRADHVSKSQLYHYFLHKEALVHAVIERQPNRVMNLQQPYFEQLDSMAAFQRWRDFMVQWYENGQTPHGCRIGSLANEVASTSATSRVLLGETFRVWQSYLSDGLCRMRRNGEIDPNADPDELGISIVAALEGGYLLAKTARDIRPFRLALDLAMGHIRLHITPTSGKV